MIKVVEEYRTEQHGRPAAAVVVAGTGTGVAVVLATGAGIEMPFCLVLELLKPC
jgi:hypothetical protein